MFPRLLVLKAVASLSTAAVVLTTASLRAEPRSAGIFVQGIKGTVEYCDTDHVWKPLPPKVMLRAGHTVRTGSDSAADLMLMETRAVVRLIPNSELSFEKLTVQSTSEESISDTRLNLRAGSRVGYTRKMAASSKFEIVTPEGKATIRGTEYIVSASGAVSVISGAVTVNYNLPGGGGDIRVTIQPGFSFD